MVAEPTFHDAPPIGITFAEVAVAGDPIKCASIVTADDTDYETLYDAHGVARYMHVHELLPDGQAWPVSSLKKGLVRHCPLAGQHGVCAVAPQPGPVPRCC